jgi:hypothetical protein
MCVRKVLSHVGAFGSSRGLLHCAEVTCEIVRRRAARTDLPTKTLPEKDSAGSVEMTKPTVTS